ncbi:MAG TPA: sigma-70 family RNA polymerase sigma factor [Pyrinomonadaceae bacterium]|nr:sigma-70 family RNA polymerase sigma factor [Pyrinomonadaceae bacterium]
MSNLKFSDFEKGNGQKMFFGKSITIGEEEMAVALATRAASVGSSVEAEFVENLKSGDAAAFDTLVLRYSGDIYVLLYRLTEDAEEASDLMQETFLQTFKAIKNFRGEADLKTWLYRIAINESRNRFRWWKRRRREKMDSLDAPTGKSETPLGETILGNFANPEDAILRREREKILIKALRDLPGIFREAVVLCDIEGLSYEEIAVALGINVGTVKSRIARGREELRRKLVDI